MGRQEVPMDNQGRTNRNVFAPFLCGPRSSRNIGTPGNSGRTGRLSEVTRTVKDGSTHDRVLHLTGNLILPHSSLALLTRFEEFGKQEGSTQAAA